VDASQTDEESRLRIEVDENRCMGVAECVRRLGSVFELGDDGVSRPQLDWKAEERDVIAAAHACPNSAIRVVAADGSPLV